jgi:hypothetical protein
MENHWKDDEVLESGKRFDVHALLQLFGRQPPVICITSSSYAGRNKFLPRHVDNTLTIYQLSTTAYDISPQTPTLRTQRRLMAERRK